MKKVKNISVKVIGVGSNMLAPEEEIVVEDVIADVPGIAAMVRAGELAVTAVEEEKKEPEKAEKLVTKKAKAKAE